MNRRRFVTHVVLLVVAAVTLTGLTAATGEPSKGHDIPWSITGVVLKTDGDVIRLNGPSGPVTVKCVRTTRVWKGEDGASVTSIRPGDEVAIRGRKSADGKVTAFEVWVNIVSLDGIIARVDGPVIDVDVVRNDSAKEIRRVRLTAKTQSSGNEPFKYEHLQVGRVVRVIGLALKDGTIQAFRIAVYVNGKPVDSL